ncbi:ADP-ribosyltransferase [Nocardia sp. BMG111209]|uniref:ADP-ribosyltransferase n=1 Tax=Nocardia sp. BMG111209 TaxID=1160137 RepID=UPI000381F385|nr:hypothetical protein [Nocardia sp. BMG111209]
MVVGNVGDGRDNLWDGGEDDFDRIPIANIRHDLSRLAEGERDALDTYLLSPDRINGALRGQREATPLIQRSIDRIRSALTKYSVPDTVV